MKVPEGASGYVADLDALGIGQAAVELGAGRQTKEEDVDPVAGLTNLKKPGDVVEEGDVLARLHTSEAYNIDAVRSAVLDAYSFADVLPTTDPLVRARCTTQGWEDKYIA